MNARLRRRLTPVFSVLLHADVVGGTRSTRGGVRDDGRKQGAKTDSVGPSAHALSLCVTSEAKRKLQHANRRHGRVQRALIALFRDWTGSEQKQDPRYPQNVPTEYCKPCLLAKQPPSKN